MEKTISLLTVLIFFLFLLSACKIHTELTASNKKIEFGDSVVLTWKTTNAKNIKISPTIFTISKGNNIYFCSHKNIGLCLKV